jgi:long-chain acyl-CoA synthetase
LLAMTVTDKPWLKHYPPDVPHTLQYPNMGLHEVLHATAKDAPEKVAVIYAEKQLTYKKLDTLAGQFAAALHSLGVGKGDRVAIYLPNIPQFMIAYFGVLKAGAAVTAISPMHREREVEHQLADSEAETIVSLDSALPVAEAVWQKTKLKRAVVTGLEDYANNTSAGQGAEKTKPNVISLRDFLKTDAQPPKVPINPSEDLAALQYTGGTTGTAKGAMLTHRNLVANAVAFAAWIKGTSEDTFLAALPLFHIYGMTTSMNVPITLGARIVLLSRFDPVKTLVTVQKHKTTVLCGSPIMYQTLLANPDLSNYDLTSIRVCISGASPLPPEVQRRFMQVTGGFLAEGYGLTEASPVTHCNPVDPTMKTVRVGSIGLPLPDTEARIVDVETGTRVLDTGETGELAVRGPQVMKGYWHRPEETAQVLRGGWLLTGDIARTDTEGYFYITDRKKDLIKYKDYSVYPRELEDILYEHPAVKLCAVVGKPDAAAGEIPKAYIVLKEDSLVSEKGIIEFANGKVAVYKAIREMEFRKDLPVSSAGKVLRRVLHEEEKTKANSSK